MKWAYTVVLGTVFRIGLFIFLMTGCIRFASLSDRPDQRQWTDLIDGIRSYEEGRFPEATRRFLKMIESYPGSPLLVETQWLLVNTYSAAGEKGSAIRELRTFLKNYPNSAHEEEARTLLLQLEESHKKTVAVSWFPSPVKTLEDQFIQFRKQGTNTVMIRLFDNTPGKDGLFFRGNRAPVLKDHLHEWILAAHRAGFRVVAEMPLREMNWFARSHPEGRDQKYDSKNRQLQATNKLDLFNTDVQRMILQLYRDVSLYPIDGIYINDISYGMEEGWSLSAFNLYQDLFSERLDPALLFPAPEGFSQDKLSYPSLPQFWHWIGWRSRFMNKFLKEIQAEVQSVRPGILFGVGIPEALLLDPVKGLAELSNDLLELNRSQFDFYLLISEGNGLTLPVLLEKLSRYAIRPEDIWLQWIPSSNNQFLSAFLRSRLKGVVFLNP